MSSYKYLAEPYAKAAYSFALETKSVTSWMHMLKQISACVANEEINKMSTHPLYSQDDIAKIIFDVLENNIDSHAKNIINILAHYNKIMIIPQIYSLFKSFKERDEKVKKATIISISELSEEYLTGLKLKLEKRFNSKIEIKLKIDKTIIGGLIIMVDDLIIDASSKGKLERLAKELLI